MAEVVNCALAQWAELKVFCSDGAVPIDNNVSEREMKSVVLNHKNSLFVGKPARRSDGSDPGQPNQHLQAPRHRPATLSHPVVDEPADNAHERTIYLAAQSMEATSGRKNG